MTRRLLAGPSEGWSSLGLVLLMCVTMAWSIDDIAPVLGRVQYTDFLMWAAVAGVLFGFVGPQVGWGRWRTYLIGSIFAALVLPIIVGGILQPNDGSWLGQYQATAGAVVNAFLDLVVTKSPFTQEFGHHLWVLGLLVWATSMFASYAAFGHHRPLNAVVMVGVMLVITMSLTLNEQLGYLVVYSLASLFLLIRFHAMEEQAEWLRRRIGDPTAISSIYLRGGSLFIAIAVVGSLLLTFAARSNPLAGAWDDVSATVIDMSSSFAKFLPVSPNNRSFDADFNDETRILGFWVGTDQVAATIAMPPTTPKDIYWRARTFDAFHLTSWTSTIGSEVIRSPDDPLLDGTIDAIPSTLATQSITFTVTPGQPVRSILSPLIPQSIDQTATLETTPEGFFAGLTRRASAVPYTVTAVIPVRDESGVGGLEENRLREAGMAYPNEVRLRYLAPSPAGTMGANATSLLAEMVAAIPGGRDATPFDIAKGLERQFRGSRFTYKTDVTSLPCAEERLSTVECFATHRTGYCQYYATTMAIFLRELGIPSRIAEGYLPGVREERIGIETLTGKNKHEWVEIYFPGYGWVPFDPTGGNVAALEPLPSGAPVVSSTPRPSTTFGPVATGGDDGRDPSTRPGGVAGPTTGGGPSSGLLGAMAVLLMVIFGAVSFIVWRRGPRGGTSPERAYGTVTRIAKRLGYGPRPNQTVYEYAGALGDVLPDARPALETVARAKVESTYGRASFGEDRLQGLRDAERRLRVSLLRLLFRRGKRPF